LPVTIGLTEIGAHPPARECCTPRVNVFARSHEASPLRTHRFSNQVYDPRSSSYLQRKTKTGASSKPPSQSRQTLFLKQGVATRFTRLLRALSANYTSALSGPSKTLYINAPSVQCCQLRRRRGHIRRAWLSVALESRDPGFALQAAFAFHSLQPRQRLGSFRSALVMSPPTRTARCLVRYLSFLGRGAASWAWD